MVNRLLRKFTNYICESSDEDEKEVFLYGLEAIVSTTECLGLSFLICCLLHEAYFGFFYILLLSVIKIRLTSFHCTTRFRCSMCYLFTVLLNLWYFKYIGYASLTIMLMMIALILCLRKEEITKKLLFFYTVYIAIFIIFRANLGVIIFQVFSSQLGLILLKDFQLRGSSSTHEMISEN
ncbi:hypothetical protein DXA09_16575 [Absiella sp. AM54-8XD]|uniref:accessory gene regulator B family protein n=1 Tax=unclassified Amedibacterium TaxID=3088137 RepID=UPI000E418D3F|nr:hypothetical protein DXA09_16575 [Absiella sp. AM54-8XD]RGC44507.1 hypothetical protein DW761_19750 [Absiella sp. AM29-15]